MAFKNKYYKFFKQIIGFMIAGLPSFILAIPLNWILVEKVLLYKPLAYLISLFFQVTINFFMLRTFVFKEKSKEKLLIQYLKFLVGISFFRFLDWGLYTILVTYTAIYYIYIQMANVLLFSVFKFMYSKYILEKS